MATDIGNLQASVTVDIQQFVRGMLQVKQQVSEFQQNLQSAGSVVGGFASSMLKVAGGVAVFEALRRTVENTAVAGIRWNASMEQAQIGFTTMLGSAQAAHDMLQQLADFAARTPFEFPDLRSAAEKMLAMGFSAQSIIPTLTAVGDAASGLGMSASEGINRIVLALGQMQAKGTVTGEEMRQLTEAGVPAWQMLADAMGKSTGEVMKLSQQGLIPAKQAVDALVAGMEQRFPGMMQAQSRTFDGLISTLRDDFGMLMGDVMVPAFERAKQLVQELIDKVQDLRFAFEQGGLAGAVQAAFGGPVGTVLAEFTKAIEKLFGFIIDSGPAVKDILTYIGISLFVMVGVPAIISGLITAFGALRTATFLLRDAFLYLQASNPATWIPLAISLAATLAVAFATHGQAIINFVANGVNLIGHAFANMFYDLRAGFDRVLNAIASGFKWLFDQAAKLPGVGGSFKAIADAIGQSIEDRQREIERLQQESDKWRAKADQDRKAMADAFKGIASPVDLLNKAIKDGQAYWDAYNEAARRMQAQSQASQKATEDFTVSARTASDVLTDMAKALDQAAVKEQLLGDRFDFNQAKLQILQSAFDELVKMGLKPTDSTLQSLAKRIDAVSDAMDRAKGKTRQWNWDLLHQMEGEARPVWSYSGQTPAVQSWGAELAQREWDQQQSQIIAGAARNVPAWMPGGSGGTLPAETPLMQEFWDKELVPGLQAVADRAQKLGMSAQELAQEQLSFLQQQLDKTGSQFGWLGNWTVDTILDMIAKLKAQIPDEAARLQEVWDKAAADRIDAASRPWMHPGYWSTTPISSEPGAAGEMPTVWANGGAPMSTSGLEFAFLEGMKKSLQGAGIEEQYQLLGQSLVDARAQFGDTSYVVDEIRQRMEDLGSTMYGLQARSDALQAELEWHQSILGQVAAWLRGKGRDDIADGLRAWSDAVHEWVTHSKLGQLLGGVVSGVGSAALRGAPILSNVIQGAQQGAAGGPMGMLAGAAVALIASSNTFQILMGNINPLLQALADAIGAILEPLLPLVNLISTVLTPIFQALGTILGSVFAPVLQALFPVLKLFGEAVLTVALIFAAAWNAVASAINFFLGWLGVHLGLIDTKGLNDAMTTLTNLTWDAAKAKAEETAATQAVTEALRNVPSGWKVALSRWEVAEPVPAMAEGGIVTRPTLALVGERGPEAVVPLGRGGAPGGSVEIHIHGDVYGWDDFKRKVTQAENEYRRSRGLAGYGLAGARL